MRNKKGLALLAIACILAFSPGCQKKSGPESKATKSSGGGGGDVVAKVGEVAITLKEFEDQINQQNPMIRSRYQSVEQKKKLLDGLVEREAMFLEAKRLKLDEDPEVVHGVKKILARQLVNVEFNQKRIKDIDVTDQEIERYYQENQDRYHSPEKVRVHQIFLSAEASDPKKRKEARKEAADLVKELKAKIQDRRLFLTLAREHSQDEETKRVGGDTNFKTRAQLEEAYGKAFADAAFALKQANETSNIIEDRKGLYILRLSGKQPAIDLPLEKVKGQIRTTLFARARGDAYKAFVDDVKNRVGVEVFADAIDKAKVDLSGVPPAPQPPMPGSLAPQMEGPFPIPGEQPGGPPGVRAILPQAKIQKPPSAGKPASP